MKKPVRKTFSVRIDEMLMKKARALNLDLNSMIEEMLRKVVK